MTQSSSAEQETQKSQDNSNYEINESRVAPDTIENLLSIVKGACCLMEEQKEEKSKILELIEKLKDALSLSRCHAYSLQNSYYELITEFMNLEQDNHQLMTEYQKVAEDYNRIIERYNEAVDANNKLSTEISVYINVNHLLNNENERLLQWLRNCQSKIDHILQDGFCAQPDDDSLSAQQMMDKLTLLEERYETIKIIKDKMVEKVNEIIKENEENHILSDSKTDKCLDPSIQRVDKLNQKLNMLYNILEKKELMIKEKDTEISNLINTIKDKDVQIAQLEEAKTKIEDTLMDSVYASDHYNEKYEEVFKDMKMKLRKKDRIIKQLRKRCRDFQEETTKKDIFEPDDRYFAESPSSSYDRDFPKSLESLNLLSSYDKDFLGCPISKPDLYKFFGTLDRPSDRMKIDLSELSYLMILD